MIKRTPLVLQDKGLTLSDVVLELCSFDNPFVKRVTALELDELLIPHEHTGLVTYEVIPVTLYGAQASHPNNHLFMVFVNNGLIYYQPHDVLSDVKLDEPSFFTYIHVHQQPCPATLYDISLSTQENEGVGTQDWTFDFNYDHILSTFYLQGGQDIASFAGFFMVE